MHPRAAPRTMTTAHPNPNQPRPGTTHAAGVGVGFDSGRRSLASLARAARLILISQRSARIVAAVLAAALALGAIDYALRLPTPLRTVHLLGGVVLVALAVWKLVIPAFRLRPSDASLALRVERLRPELAGLLASAVEFERPDDRRGPIGADGFERALAARVVDRARAEFEPTDTRGVLRLKPFAHSFAVLALSVAAAAGVAFAQPGLSKIGVARTLAPWSGAEWPKRTMVADATGLEVHPLGAAIPLRAALLRSHREPENTDVYVEHRAIRDGRAAGARRDLLTWQRRGDTSAGSGELFERLIEASGDAIEYRFVTLDDRTVWRRLMLVDRPAVASAAARITPPDYARELGPAGPGGAGDAGSEIDLGVGTDERAIAPASLAGSRVRLNIILNKPVPAAPDDPGWLAATLGPDAARDGVAVSIDPADPSRWTIEWTLGESARLAVALADEFGITSADDAVFRFESLVDRPPTATITDPASDQTVLASAVVEIVGEGRDDVGLASLALDRQRHSPAGASPSGPGGAIEPTEEPVQIAQTEAAGASRAVVRATLDLAPLKLSPGDQVWISAIATDVFALGAGTREPTRSPVRVLRVITDAEFVSEIQAELGSIRQGAIRAFEEQQGLREMAPQRRAAAEAQRRQAQLTERLARLAEQLGRVERRVSDNALGDRQLENVLDDADRLLRDSGEWSARASDRQAEAEDARDPDDPAIDPERERQIDDAQQRVQDELAALAELLDTGQDAWVARRRLEQMIDAQRALAERTAQAGRQTAGKPAEDLTDAERAELEEIVEAQQELAEQADELADDLEQRAEQAQERDPTSAQGMRQAARRARESQVSETMRQAASQAQQNQTAAAGEQQQQAAEELEQMLEDLDNAERSREEALRRVLASLIESLEGLIAQQVDELAALDRAGDNPVGLDRGMIRLNQNTLGVMDLASSSGRELAPVVDLIGRAVEAQTRAILALRSDPPSAAEARPQEERSLGLLREAKERAEEIDREMQARQQDRARRELRAAYAGALERQVALREATAAIADAGAPDRRGRVELRRLAGEQRDIAGTLDELYKKTAELAEAAVFDYAHRRLAATTADAAVSLDDAEAIAALTPEDSTIAVLQGLVEALQDPQQNRDFDSGQQQAGGGGGGAGGEQPLIPPIAELRLLRQIQIDLARRTRAAAEAPAPRDKARALGEEQAELGELGNDLIRRMEQQQGGPPAPTSPAPTPPTPPSEGTS